MQASTGVPKVLVSVLSYNSLESTVKTLRSLSRLNYPNFRLQLVDNNSSQDFLSAIESAFPDLPIITLPTNSGYTGGNNYAIRQALREGYDYVLIANHDIELEEDALSRLVETATACPSSGAVGGVVVEGETGRVQGFDLGRLSKWTGRWGVKTEVPEGAQNYVKVETVQGALVLLTERAIRAGSYFDENIFMYCDEFDLASQLGMRGLDAFVDRRVAVKHYNPLSVHSKVAGYFVHRNRVYLAKKYGQWYHLCFYLLYASLLELPARVIVKLFQGHRKFALACIYGHIDGIRGFMNRGSLDEVKSL